MAESLAQSPTLLGPTDPAPVGLRNILGCSPFFLICDHAGNAVPAALHDLGLDSGELGRHIGIDIGILMGGIVVVESVFGWPGIGQLAWQAIQRVDIPIIMGVTLVSACAIVLGNLLADIVAPFIDPRIKLRCLIVSRRRDWRVIFQSIHPPMFAPVTQKGVRRYPVQPSPVIRILVEPSKGTERLEKGLLIQIIGIGGVSSQLQRVPVQLHPVAMKHRFETHRAVDRRSC